jgi:ribonuclease HI
MIIYTDGSAYYKDGSAGFGVIYIAGPQQFYGEFGALPPYTTVQQSELLAVIHALSNPNVTYPCKIISDSHYVVEGMNTYARVWLAREMSRYGLTVFQNDTVLDLYRMIRKTAPEGPLELEGSGESLVANIDQWEQLWSLLLQVGPVTFEHVPGHGSDRWNNWADLLAVEGRQLSYDLHQLTRYEPARKDRRLR